MFHNQQLLFDYHLDEWVFFCVIVQNWVQLFDIHRNFLQLSWSQQRTCHSFKLNLTSNHNILQGRRLYLNIILGVPYILKWLQKKANAYAKLPSLTVTTPYSFCSFVRLFSDVKALRILNTLVNCWSSLLR